jgi:hypothetical protein
MTRCVIVLMQFSDAPHPAPQPGSFYEDLIRNDAQSLNQYWQDASLGAVELTTTLFDWHTTNTSSTEFVNRLHSSGVHRDLEYVSLANSHPAFREAIESGGPTRVPFDLVFLFALGNGPLDDSLLSNGADYNTALLPFPTGGLMPPHVRLLPVDASQVPDSYGLNYLARQVGHYLGLSWSRDNSEYEHEAFRGSHGVLHDSYDLMSSGRITHQFRHTRFSSAGPLLSAAQSFIHHWLPGSSVHFLADDRPFTTDICLTSLSWFATTGRRESPPPATPLLLINIGNHFTIELRSREGWDAGIPTDQTIVIHKLYQPTGSSEITPILMKSVRVSTADPFPHEWTVGQTWDSSQAGNSAISEPSLFLIGSTLITVLSYDPVMHMACVRIEHQVADPAWPIYVQPDRLYYYNGCLLILDGQLMQFPKVHTITTINRKLIAIE